MCGDVHWHHLSAAQAASGLLDAPADVKVEQLELHERTPTSVTSIRGLGSDVQGRRSLRTKTGNYRCSTKNNILHLQ